MMAMKSIRPGNPLAPGIWKNHGESTAFRTPAANEAGTHHPYHDTTGASTSLCPAAGSRVNRALLHTEERNGMKPHTRLTETEAAIQKKTKAAGCGRRSEDDGRRGTAYR